MHAHHAHGTTFLDALVAVALCGVVENSVTMLLAHVLYGELVDLAVASAGVKHHQGKPVAVIPNQVLAWPAHDLVPAQPLKRGARKKVLSSSMLKVNVVLAFSLAVLMSVVGLVSS